MTDLRQHPQHALWAKIEKEKRTDQLIKVVSKSSWSVTFMFLIGFAGISGYEVYHMYSLYQKGMISASSLFDTFMPFIMVIGGICLTIAILSTVGTFFRLRTSSLSEIQLRLAALEEMMVEQAGKKD